MQPEQKQNIMTNEKKRIQENVSKIKHRSCF